MSLTIILKAIELGLIFSILSLGVYISFRVLNVPDLTVDGSFATGCAVCAVDESVLVAPELIEIEDSVDSECSPVHNNCCEIR